MSWPPPVAQPATVAGSRVFATESIVPMTRDAAILADCATSVTDSKTKCRNARHAGLKIGPTQAVAR